MSASMTVTAQSSLPTPRGDRRRWWALIVIALGQLMVVFDVTIVNVALPSIGRALSISDGDRQWVVTAYTLAFAGLLLMGGRVADYLGRKRAFLIALGGFAAASAVGGAAVNLGMLVAARAGQGVFGALLAPTALSLVATTFPDPRERARAFAVFGMVMGGGSGIGLLLGGVLTEFLSWRWVMYVNTPLALAAGIGAVVTLKETRAQARARVDVLGAVLGTAGLVALVYGFNAVVSHGWTAPLTVGAFAAGLALLLAFVIAETRVPAPLLPLRIVTHRSRGGAYLAFALVSMGMFGMLLLVSFYLQTVAGYTPLQAGVAFLPFAAGVLVASMLVGRAMTQVRSGLLLAAGMVLPAAGMAWLTQLEVTSSYAGGVLPAVLLTGLGVGIMGPVAANLATYAVAERDSGVASGVFNASEQIGASVGLAILSTIAVTTTDAYLAAHPDSPGPPLAGVVHGHTTATAWAALVLVIGAIVVYMLVNARLGHASRDQKRSSSSRCGRRAEATCCRLSSRQSAHPALGGVGIGPPAVDLARPEETGMATFRTTLLASGGNNVGIVVPEDVVLSFGRGKRVPVTVTIDGGYTYRNTISSMGGQFMISFNAQTRAATGRGAGDEVEVTLEVDDAPRTVETPAVLADAFEADPKAAETWSRLSYSKQRAHAQAIEGAKTEETRKRRVDKILSELRDLT